jgi:hypothetical protein
VRASGAGNFALAVVGAADTVAAAMAKPNRWSALLVAGALALSMVTVGLSLIYALNVRSLSRLRSQAVLINNDKLLLQSLLNDCVEYSKRNPAIDPLLQEFRVKPKTAAEEAPARTPNR